MKRTESIKATGTEAFDPCKACRCPSCADEDCCQAGCDGSFHGGGCMEEDEDGCFVEKPQAMATEAATEATAAPAAPAPFDYTGMEPQEVDALVDITQEYQRHRDSSLREYVQACISVANAHTLLAAHYGGKWGEWYAAQGLSDGSAKNMLHVGHKVLGSATVAELSETGSIGKRLLQLISAPNAPEALTEQVLAGDITTAAEYKKLAAELAAEKAANEADRAANSRLLAQEQQRRQAAEEQRIAAEAQAAQATAKARQAARERDENNAAREALLDERDALTKRIAQLESRPVEVAVEQPGEADIEKYRKEGEKAAVAKTEKVIANAIENRRKAQAEADELRRRLDTLRPDMDSVSQLSDALFDTIESYRVLLRRTLAAAELPAKQYGVATGRAMQAARNLADTLQACKPAGFVYDADDDDDDEEVWQ